MANYLSRLAASGARVAFDARSPFVPPAMPPMARWQGSEPGSTGFEYDEGRNSAVLSDSYPEAGAASVDTGSSWAAVAGKTALAPDFALPQPTPPSLFSRASPVDLRQRVTAVRQAEKVLDGDGAHTSADPGHDSRNSKLKSDANVEADPAAPTRVFFPSIQHHSETAAKANQPIDSVEMFAAAVRPPSHFHSVSRKAPQPLARHESQSEPGHISDTGNTRHASQKMPPARFPSAEADAPVAGRKTSTVVFGSVTPPSAPWISRVKEPGSQISIGRVEVQVNNQPPVSPTPALPAPKAKGNRQDSLQKRFLDRFTLRP